MTDETIDPQWKKQKDAHELVEGIILVGKTPNERGLQWLCPSASNPNQKYLIVREPHPTMVGGCTWTCTCPDFHHRSPEYAAYICKHILAVQWYTINQKVVDIQGEPPAPKEEWASLGVYGGSLSLTIRNGQNLSSLVEKVKAMNGYGASIDCMKVGIVLFVEGLKADLEIHSEGGNDNFRLSFKGGELFVGEVIRVREAP